jgi:hypothetical protein
MGISIKTSRFYLIAVSGLLVAGIQSTPAMASFLMPTLDISVSAPGYQVDTGFLSELNLPAAGTLVGDTFSWSTAGPVDVWNTDHTVLLATIDNWSISLIEDPVVNLNFSVTAGSSDTTFTVSSAVVSFGTLVNPKAYASAGIMVTSDDSGATLTGLLSGKCYQAIYNGSTVFANLVDGITVLPSDMASSIGRSPSSGWTTINDNVSSMQSQFRFTLSAEQQASGMSRFEVVPEPIGLAFLALGALAFRRRQ